MEIGNSMSTGSIGSREIRNGSILNRDFKDGTLRGKEFKPDSLGPAAIKEQSLDASKIGPVNNAAIAEGLNRVRQCIYAATLGDESASGPGTGQIAVTSLASNVNGVRVVTRDSNGTPSDRSFHLIVSC